MKRTKPQPIKHYCINCKHVSPVTNRHLDINGEPIMGVCDYLPKGQLMTMLRSEAQRECSYYEEGEAVYKPNLNN